MSERPTSFSQILAALGPNDSRHVNVNVARPAALLIAKAIKIQDRLADATAISAFRGKTEHPGARDWR